MRLPSKILAIAVLATAELSACGGASDAPPGPLTTHFDDMYIATIPPAQKPTVVQTQQDWSVARMENAKAEADFNESATQLAIAQNDLKAAKLGVDSAVSAKKSAEASADTNRINQATKDLHNAEDVAKAAEARVKYIEAYRAFLKLALRSAQETMFWREAQYEVAKAQVGQQNNIAPKGISYDTFPKQESERQKRTQNAKTKLDQEKQRAMTARDTWRTAQETADRETGRSGNFPDPLAEKTTSGGSSQ